MPINGISKENKICIRFIGIESGDFCIVPGSVDPLRDMGEGGWTEPDPESEKVDKLAYALEDLAKLNARAEFAEGSVNDIDEIEYDDEIWSDVGEKLPKFLKHARKYLAEEDTESAKFEMRGADTILSDLENRLAE